METFNENFKHIHIGSCILERMRELDMPVERACSFLNISEEALYEIYNLSEMSTETLLRFSKLLHYDFFRLYSQHLILYAPVSGVFNPRGKDSSKLPNFKKNIYTKEIIEFIVYLIESKKKKVSEIIEEYSIPKVTVYRWLGKYRNSEYQSNIFKNAKKETQLPKDI